MFSIKYIIGFILLITWSSDFVECTVTGNWNRTNFDRNVDFWLSQFRYIFTNYNNEVELVHCVTRGFWELTQNSGRIEKVKTNEETMLNKLVETRAIEIVVELLQKKEEKNFSRQWLSKKPKTSALAWLLGLTDEKPFDSDTEKIESYNDDRTLISKNPRELMNSNGAVEKIVFSQLISKYPFLETLVQVFHNVFQTFIKFFKSSIILSCVSDYAVNKGSEWLDARYNN